MENLFNSTLIYKRPGALLFLLFLVAFVCFAIYQIIPNKPKCFNASGGVNHAEFIQEAKCIDNTGHINRKAFYDAKY